MTKPEINLINTADIAIEQATPAMQRFLEIKREHPDTLLLYQMGDFYETFFEDAVLISRELELVSENQLVEIGELTQKGSREFEPQKPGNNPESRARA